MNGGRVGVNLLWLVAEHVGGSEDYTVRLLRGLAERQPPGLDLTLFALAPFPAAHPDLAGHYRTVTMPSDGRNKALRVAAENTWLAARSRRHQLDLVHHAGGVVPPVRGRPAVVTIHDLQPLALPANFGAVKQRYLRTVLPWSVRSARLVLAVSRFTADDVISRLGVPAERVRVVPHGIEPAAAPSGEEEVVRVRRRYRVPGPYFVCNAMTWPHKNHPLLVEAFATVVAAVPDVTLVLTGGEAAGEGPLRDEIARRRLEGRVRRTGRIPRADLDALLSGATALTFPSRFEGFGAPVLEAMARGCPVIAADATALPEVVGDAGLLVRVDDPGAWSQAMLTLLRHDARRSSLAAAGRARAAGFGWDASAAALEAAYRDGLARSPGRSTPGDPGSSADAVTPPAGVRGGR